MTSPLTRLTSRGGVVNIVFGTAMQVLAGIQAVIIAHLLGPSILGVFALATGGVVIGTTLKDFGISQKLVQERETDLYTAYGVAFTLELVLAGASCLLVGGVVGPVLAVAYHRPVLLPVVGVLSLSVFTTAFLYLPASFPYRQMNFTRRNLILAVGPAMTFLVTVPTAFAGLGIWSLVAGNLAGLGASSAVMFLMSEVKPHLVLDRAMIRKFVSFGGPLWGAGIISTVSGWATTIVVSAILGVPSLGFFTLSQGWASQAVQVDGFLSDTLFPALCSIQSSIERQRRAFVYTCRLSMAWAATVGTAMALFAAPVIHLLVGPHWTPAILLVQAEGAGVILGSIAYSWNMFYAARGNNRPTLIASALAAVWLLTQFLPLTAAFHLRGVAGSIVLLALGSYLMRQYYLRKLFGQIRLLSMVWREWLAAGTAAGVVGLARLAGWYPHDVANLFGQGALFGVVAVAAVALLERSLLLEILRSARGDAGRVEPGESPVPVAAEGTGASAPHGRMSVPAGRPMSFPLAVAADPDGRTAWVTTRDWSALGRLDLPTMQVEWTELPPYPHVPSPDGEGGCWTALTRSSALAHVDAHGRVRTVELEKTGELLVTLLTDQAVWAVDAHRHLLWRVDRQTLAKVALHLPGLRRPDCLNSDRRGGIWVADTHSPALVVVDEETLEARPLSGPHPTRGLLPDWSGRGMWLGSSSVPAVTLVGWDGGTRARVDLPGIPFGLTRLARGVLLVTLKDRDSVAVIRPGRREVAEFPLGGASQPMGCAVSGDVAVVALAGSSEIEVIPVPEAMRSARGSARQAALVS